MLTAANSDRAARHVLSATPRLLNITNLAGMSFGLAEGATLALAELPGGSDEAREVICGYALDCTLMTVTRLALLLDGDTKVISYQSVQRCLRRPEVVTLLIRRVRAAETLPVRTKARTAVNTFLRTYDRIDVGLCDRLRKFRNRAVAHLTPQSIQKRINFEELGRLVYWVTSLGECLAPLAQNVAPIGRAEIARRSKSAKEVWGVELRRLDGTQADP
jgi:hypothetical protein